MTNYIIKIVLLHASLHSLNYRGFELDYISILEKPEQGYCNKSDLNQDSLIDVVDIIRLTNIILFGNASAFELCIADVFEDEIVNIIDIVEVVNYVLINN